MMELCTRQSRKNGGRVKMSLGVKCSLTEKENNFCKVVLVGEEEAAGREEGVGRAYNSCTGVVLVINWWGRG